MFASVQLFAARPRRRWFGDDFAPTGWAYSEKRVYLLTELLPVLVFVAVGILFWGSAAKRGPRSSPSPADAVALDRK